MKLSHIILAAATLLAGFQANAKIANADCPVIAAKIAHENKMKDLAKVDALMNKSGASKAKPASSSSGAVREWSSNNNNG